MTVKKKKVSIVITRMDLGGAQQVALETARGLMDRYDVTLIAGAGGQLDAEAGSSLGERFIAMPELVHPIRPFSDLKAFWLLYKYFLSEETDVVHTHSSKAGLLGRVAAWAAGVPVIVHTVHGWSFYDPQKNPARWAFIQLEKLLAHITTRLAVVAESCRDKGLLNGIGQPAQYQLLRAAVDLKAWSSTPAARQGRTIGCIANCKEQKNPLDFVRVAAKVLAAVPEAKFVYVGDGPLRAEAEALAASQGVAEHVRFMGWVEDPRAVAASFDLFLLTSLWEGLPCVFPQVLSMGIPVVATGVDGAPEIIREGLNGYLCQPGDIDGLADRLVSILKKPELSARLSAQAKGSVGSEYGFEDMVQRTAVLYELAA